ncbi:MAG TPA: alpha/beta hydrolase [Acidobacteria bacterium]|nr:alpha/beta hydrolase [Acidobacteriota bacterium]
MRWRAALLLAGSLWTTVPGLAEAGEAAPRLVLTPCRLPGVPDMARCGTYEVFENRETRAGRKIALRVAVLPALGPERLPDPILFFDGGPGEPSVSDAAWHEETLKPLRRRRDIVLIDARGTGGSGALDCAETAAAKLQGYLDDFLPLDQVRACRELLQRRADLTQYTTERMVDDKAEVAAALGYDALNLMGTSYGTRAVLVFLRRHPGKARTATIVGVLPTDARVPLPAARNAQRAFEALVAACEREAACASGFPDLRGDLAEVLRQVEEKAVEVAATDPDTEREVALTLTREGVAQTVRYLLYGDFGLARLPWVLHSAARGDFRPMGEMALLFGATATGGSRGLYLSVTCAEDVAFIRPEDIPAAAAGTFLGDFRVRRQIDACKEWPAARLDPAFRQHVVSDVPVLALAGEHDVTTPPEDAARVVRHLSRGRLVVVPHRSHGVLGGEGTACVVDVIDQFLAAGSAERLDTACIERIPPVPFLTARSR